MHTSSSVFALKIHVFYCNRIDDTPSSVFHLTRFLFCCTGDNYCVPIYHPVIEASSNPTTHTLVKTHHGLCTLSNPSRPSRIDSLTKEAERPDMRTRQLGEGDVLDSRMISHLTMDGPGRERVLEGMRRAVDTY